ncbi:hypothetical protein [Caballeronia sp. Lep1P3]|uniref:hypothetical protein n=1 Tax=Caballeronia sp. Lep1P3 TaxID=2878150 RepID=UPI001FD38F01|nr:hypothetical protein [Caballeronia sp. Lep1P3]
MNYLTIIAAVWTVCAIFAVLFIRGATARDQKPARVQSPVRQQAPKAVRHTA